MISRSLRALFLGFPVYFSLILAHRGGRSSGSHRSAKQIALRARPPESMTEFFGFAAMAIDAEHPAVFHRGFAAFDDRNNMIRFPEMRSVESSS